MLSKPSQKSSTWLFDVVTLLVFLAVFYALWIGSHALFTPDEGRYSEVAREMVVTGDYITPRLNGVAFLDKPALYYWLQAIAINLFGLKEWALRFWPALMGVFSSLVVYFTGRILFDRRTGVISALILATSPLYYGAAHYANLDLEVAALIGNSLLCFIAAMQSASQKTKTFLLLAFYLFAGLAALTKGLIGIAFPAMIIGAWIILLNRWRTLLNMNLLGGLVIFLAITLPWYYLVQKANPEFLHFFFVTQQVSRFLTLQDFNDKAAFWFYIPVVMGGFFPWSLFLIQAVYQKLQVIWKNKNAHAAELFLVLWLFMVLIFFSIPHSKTVGYILPLFPACALLVGSYLNVCWDKVNSGGVKAGKTVFTYLSIVLGIGFLVAPFFRNWIDIPSHFIPYLLGLGVLLLIAGAISHLLKHRPKLGSVFTCLTLTIAISLLVFSAGLDTVNDKSIKPLVQDLKPHLQADDEVVAYYKYYQDLPIYLQRRVTIVADWHASDIPQKDNWVREIWYGMVFQDTKDWLIEEPTFWQRWHSAKRLFVITDENYFHKLEQQTTVYKISEQNHIVLLSNQPDVILSKNP